MVNFSALHFTLINRLLPFAHMEDEMRFLLLLLSKVTPDFRQLLVGMLDQLAEKAKSTANPYDDIAVAVLRKVLQA